MKGHLTFSRKSLITSFILASILASCHNIPDNSGKNLPFKIDIENCKTLIDLKLSDLIDSCTLVQLETTEESIIGGFFRYIYISDKYIIIDDTRGVFLFRGDGKFISKLINVGRGPGEISISHTFYYSEKKNLLFINDLFNNMDKILCYDIESQSFLPPIIKCFSGQWGDFMVYNDSVIMGSLSGTETNSNPYALFFQDFNGRFISGIESKRKYIRTKNMEEDLQRMLFYSDDQKTYAKYFYDDTLFILDDKHLSPYLIIEYNSLRTNPPKMIPEIEDKRTTYERFGNPHFIIFRNSTFMGFIPLTTGSKADYENAYFILDKSFGNYALIRSFTDDLTGEIQTSENETMYFPVSLPNNRLYALYRPNQLLQQPSINSIMQEFPKSLYDQLNKIKSSLNATDNPILLIGKPKKRLLIPK
jgi:hypothetical protein